MGTCVGFEDLVAGTLDPCSIENQKIEEEKFSPRIGVSYDIRHWPTFFGNYAKSLGNPAGGVLADGSPAGYEGGEQGEVGLKRNF